MSDLTAVFVAIVLLAFNAFFVGAEFALVSARRTQIEPRAKAGSSMARTTLRAMESAGVTLVKGDLNGIVRARRLSRLTIKAIRQNLFLAFVYNGLSIPLAAVGILTPMIAAAAMSLSSVSVIGNSLRLQHAKLND